jgi:DNA-binding transcriptional regulator YiaG
VIISAITPATILAARNLAGLTQSAAANSIGYSARAWQSWELGARKMRPEIFKLFLSKTTRGIKK